MKPALIQAIERVVPPRQVALAHLIDATPQEVNRWVKRGWASPRYCPAIERATGIALRALIEDASTAKAAAKKKRKKK